jgi:gluconolactonase
MTFTRRSATLGLSTTLLAAGASMPVLAKVSGPILGRVRRLSPTLDAVIAPDAVIEQLAEGYVWSEGPVWVKDGGYLLFSDVPGNVMYRWSEVEGATVFLKPSGYDGPDPSAFREPGSNGLALDAAGRLLVCDHGNRALARVDLKTKAKTILVDRYQGKRFNSPNDLAVAKSGAIYFTDPPYGLAGINDSPIKELAFSGVYRFTPDGAVTLIDGGLTFPNGIALSPDERRLYVSVSDPDRPVIMVYDLGPDGLPTGPGKVFFDTKPLQGPAAPGNPDGMALDVDGRLFATGPGGVLVLTPRAELIGVIETGHAIANCAFGEDGRTLFLTSDHVLARVRLRTTGLIT